MRTICEALIYLSWALMLVVWLPGYFTDNPAGEGPRRGWQIANTALLFSSILVMLSFGAPGLSRVLGAPALGRRLTPLAPGLELAGVALAFSGIAFAVWARRTLGRNWSDGVMRVKDEQELVQTGPYATVRHPIYTGLLIAMAGTAIGFGTLAAYVGVAAGMVAVLVRVNVEEQLMSARFGTAHEIYRRQSKKLVPFLW